jgi:tryptophan 2,3-dioxygenase/ketosteroid isomerase-like protein
MPGPLRPSPYDLWIGFQDGQDLWQCASDHPDERAARCAFTSIEMGLVLLLDAAQDDRPAARSAARVQALADNVADQLRLARRVLRGGVPASLLVGAPAPDTAFVALASLGAQHRGAVDTVTDALLLGGFPALGVEQAAAEARAAHGLPPRALPQGPFLPYAAWAQPGKVAALVLRDPVGPEDRLFATVHQMTECWLRLVLEDFARAEAASRTADWHGASAAVEEASAVLEFLGRHIELLHLMVVADYHPMRVGLRGASGAQSAAARVAAVGARHFLAPFLRDLGQRGLTPLDVLRAAHEHPAEHRFAEALSTLDRRLSMFYFQHFHLARKVLGTRSLGSLGYEVKALAERFTSTLFPALDDARFDHTMLTNAAHGDTAGHLIAAREVGLVEAAPPPAPSIEQEVAEDTIRRYFEAIRAFDAEAWVALFDPRGTMEDPVGSRPHRGLGELRVFFSGVERTFVRLDVQPGPLELRGAVARVRWQARGEAYNGRAVAFEGLEEFDLARDGRILAVRVWWDPAVLVPQMLAPAPAQAPAPGGPAPA